MPGVVRQFPIWDFGTMRLNLVGGGGGAVTAEVGCTQDAWKRLFDWLPPSVETEGEHLTENREAAGNPCECTEALT